MSYKVFLTKSANRDFEKIPTKEQLRVKTIVDSIADDPFALDIKKLKTPFEGFRIRSGDYRVLFVVAGKDITIYSIKHRKDVYRL